MGNLHICIPTLEIAIENCKNLTRLLNVWREAWPSTQRIRNWNHSWKIWTRGQSSMTNKNTCRKLLRSSVSTQNWEPTWRMSHFWQSSKWWWGTQPLSTNWPKWIREYSRHTMPWWCLNNFECHWGRWLLENILHTSSHFLRASGWMYGYRKLS